MAKGHGEVLMCIPDRLQRMAAAVAAELDLGTPEITRLASGSANLVLRLRDARHDLVLRIAGPQAAKLGADPAAEQAMLSLAARAGLAPPLVLARPEQGILVTRHAAGRILASEDLRDPVQLARIGAWIAALQAQPPPPLPRIDFGARAAGYLATLQARASSTALDRLARGLALRRARLPAVPAVCCHHDLHHRNFIDSGERLLAVDWEYAGPGDPAADLASCIGYHGLGPAEQEALLGGFGDTPLRDRLSALAWIFDCLWYGWNAVAALEGVPPDAELQARLEARLLG
jgi:thiamine kinase-like enzyme